MSPTGGERREDMGTGETPGELTRCTTLAHHWCQETKKGFTESNFFQIESLGRKISPQALKERT